MPDRRQNFGIEGENLAVNHLRKLGYKIIERNFKTRTGEIDIVAKHKGQIVFAEVKTRQTSGYGHPKESVTATKQRKISMVALTYLKKHHSIQTRARFDVVTVRSTEKGPLIEVFPNAFDLAYG